ncbi:flagellar motor switch protein FliN [Desulfatirhabdium butyrativorans]|uniref:flagellar motor switch protein FliN n=1 Tax=Desulfatirhabdium butyrativorans TaxID=340467 RepID=UPI000408ECD6|nr:flagellar motor switch protein FliN [Desulfatirhabdium butyrativorans]
MAASDSPTSQKTGSPSRPLPPGQAQGNASRNLEFILDVPLEITVELGRTRMAVNDLLKLGQGSVIELEKSAGDTLEVLANQRLIARGEVVAVNEKYGIRLTEIISPMERIQKLK